MVKRQCYKIEYPFNAKAELLYNYISMPYNLAIWFADDVKINHDILTFTWEGSIERAKITKQVLKKKFVFKWIDRPDDEYLTFDIETDEVTGGTVLYVSDYDEESEIDEAKLMWDRAIEKLKRTIGG